MKFKLSIDVDPKSWGGGKNDFAVRTFPYFLKLGSVVTVNRYKVIPGKRINRLQLVSSRSRLEVIHDTRNKRSSKTLFVKVMPQPPLPRTYSLELLQGVIEAVPGKKWSRPYLVYVQALEAAQRPSLIEPSEQVEDSNAESFYFSALGEFGHEDCHTMM